MVTQGQVRKGVDGRGCFEVFVEEEGRYQFDLRRWPVEEDLEITAGIEESTENFRDDVVLKKYRNNYIGGKSMPFVSADITIAGQKEIKDLDANANYARFESGRVSRLCF